MVFQIDRLSFFESTFQTFENTTLSAAILCPAVSINDTINLSHQPSSCTKKKRKAEDKVIMHWRENKQKREKTVTVPQCIPVWFSGKARERVCVCVCV